jgi:ribose-phosphate pyrophosphokinase
MEEQKMSTSGVKIFGGSSNPALTQRICEILDIPKGKILLGREPGGEITVEIKENIRGADVFFVQSGSPHPNRYFVELLTAVDALSRSFAGRITAVMPYYSYSGTTSSKEARSSIVAGLKADLLEHAGVNHTLTMEMHSLWMKGYFRKIDHMLAAPIFTPYIREKFRDQKGNIVIVDPDGGSNIRMARAYAATYLSDYAVGYAVLDSKGKGTLLCDFDIKGKCAILVDDIVNTANTIVASADILLNKGVKEVHAIVTHGMLSGNALEKIDNCGLSSLALTDTIALQEDLSKKIAVVTASKLFAHAISSIHNNESISGLFRVSGR